LKDIIQTNYTSFQEQKRIMNDRKVQPPKESSKAYI